MVQGFGDYLKSGIPVSGDFFHMKKSTAAEWKTYCSPEQVSGVLDYTFTLPPPGAPVVNHRTGEVVSRMNFWRIEEMPPDMRDSRMTRSASIAARKEALEKYDSLKEDVLGQIEDETRLRQDLVDKLAGLSPDDEDGMAMRELLTEYVGRLDKSLVRARDRLENLEAEYGPQGKYRLDICPEDENFCYSGTIYNEDLLIKLSRAETVDDMIARAGDLMRDLTEKMEGFPADANGKLRDEMESYIWKVKDRIATAKERLKEEFGLTDEEITAAINAAAVPVNPAMVNELGDEQAPPADESFLQAAAEHQKQQLAAGVGSPFDRLNQFLGMIDRAAAAMRVRMQPLADGDYSSWAEVFKSQAESQSLPAQSLPTASHVVNPALINEMAEMAEAAE